MLRTDARRLLVWLTRRCYDAQLATDLVGETFARAYADRRSFRGNGPDELSAWLFGIARNVLHEALRRGRDERRRHHRAGDRRGGRRCSDEKHRRHGHRRGGRPRPGSGGVATRAGLVVDTAPAYPVPLAARNRTQAIDTICPPPRPTAPARAKPAAAPVRDAFGVLRRERTPRDSLSPVSAVAVADAGYGSADLEAARLLRTTAAGGKAWIVPVAEVQSFGALLLCAVELNRRAGRSRRGRTPAVPRFGGTGMRRDVIPPAAVRRLRPRGPRLPLPPVPAPLRTPEPGPGVIVVAAGGAGGTLTMLVRGLAPVEVRPCTGRGGDLLSVSGLVPDGVGASSI